MSAPAVILSADEFAALVKRLEEVERRVSGGLPAATLTLRDFQTPREVARRFGVGDATVYEALASGRLPAEARPGKNKTGRVWRINPEDARTWYATFVAMKPGKTA